MFSLHDIDEQITWAKMTADDLDERATIYEANPYIAASLRGAAQGFRESAKALERMIERAVEAEAREAMR